MSSHPPGTADGERALVTGANGFIGAALVEHLLGLGAEVVAVVHHATERLQPLGHPNLRIVPVDLRSDEALHEVVTGARPTAAYHLAWLTEPGSYMTSIPWNLASVRFSLSLVEQLLEVGCRRLVGAGSCAEYALGPDVLTESSPTGGGAVYGAAKVATATAALAAARAAGATLAWARIFYVHGPREDPRRAVPQLVAGAAAGEPPPLNKPDQVRDFLHVEDVAAALAFLGRTGVDGPVNVCSGHGVTLRALWERLQDAVAPERPPVPLGPPSGGDEPPIVGDPSRLRSLGWAPAHDPAEALAATTAWWLRDAGARR